MIHIHWAAPDAVVRICGQELCMWTLSNFPILGLFCFAISLHIGVLFYFSSCALLFLFPFTFLLSCKATSPSIVFHFSLVVQLYTLFDFISPWLFVLMLCLNVAFWLLPMLPPALLALLYVILFLTFLVFWSCIHTFFVFVLMHLAPFLLMAFGFLYF